MRTTLAFRATLMAAVLCVAVTGCGDPVQIDITSSSTYSLYGMGDTQGAINQHCNVDPADNSFGLHMSMLASAYMARGDYDQSYRALRSAYDLMNGFITDQGGEPHFYKPESNKTWIGDPVEMSLNSWYMAILNFRRGDFSNSIAACKNAILADQPLKWEEQSEADIQNNVVPTEKYVDDMGMLYLLETRAMLRASGWTKNDVERVVTAGKDAFLRTPLFDPATAAAKVNQLFADAQDLNKNVIFVVDLGLCPKHSKTGEYGEIIKISETFYPDKNARLVVNGQILPTDRVCDVHYQKIHRGTRAFDETLNGRAIFKENAMEGGKLATGVGVALLTSDNANARAAGAVIAGVGLLFMAFSASTHPEADLRQWEALPGQINMVFVGMKPGKYTVECEGLGIDMNALPVPRLETQEFEVPSKGDVIVYLRPLPVCGNPSLPLNAGPVNPDGANADTNAVQKVNDHGEGALAKESEKQNTKDAGTPAKPDDSGGWGAKTPTTEPPPSQPKPATPPAPNSDGWGK